jgi:quercetin dioxygenase-like cupin family protein
MKVQKLDEMTRGWFIGDFEPSVLKTKDFEVAIMQHPKGQVWQSHYHAIATEYNVLLSGKMKICNVELEAGDIFVIEPYEIADPIFHEDCTIVCVKVPGSSKDKFLV